MTVLELIYWNDMNDLRIRKKCLFGARSFAKRRLNIFENVALRK